MWEAALDRITSLVGRAFVIGSLVPVLLFTGVNLISVMAVFGGEQLRPLIEISKSYPLAFGIGVAVVLVASGYLLAIIGPVAKRLLEGTYDLGSLTEKLKGRKRRDFVRRRETVQAAAEQAGKIPERCAGWLQRLQALNKQRREGGLTLSPAGGKLKEIEDKIRVCSESGQIAEITTLSKLCQDLEFLYTLDSPLDSIERLHRGFTELCEDVKGLAQGRYARALADLQSRYASIGRSADVQATTLGNVMDANWSYAYTRFGVDAAFMWSRLKGFLSETHARSVEDDRIAFDFCVSLTGLSALHSVLWMVIVTLRWPPHFVLRPLIAYPALPPPVWQVLVPLSGAAATVVFYLAAIEAARSFGNDLRSCFDLFRFQLLTALHIELPKDIESERQAWGALNSLFVYGDSRERLTYHHLNQPEEPKEKPTSGGLLARLVRLVKG